MDEQLGQEVAEARRRFEQACDLVRPDLHRFCTRMTGDPCDGEDVLQDALVLAFYRFAELHEPSSFRAWVFRIAYNKCIDFLRRRKRFDSLEDDNQPAQDRTMDQSLDDARRVERAVTRMIVDLAPRERACIVLKDVLDWSLDDTADITGSTVGAVKAALHRGRAKLEHADSAASRRSVALAPRHRALVERYLAAFNRRDWDGVLALLADEARLEVVHRSEGPFRGACYLENYGRLSWAWKLAIARVDGVESIVHFREKGGEWVPHSVVQIGITEDRVALVRDYVHVDYLLHHCAVT